LAAPDRRSYMQAMAQDTVERKLGSLTILVDRDLCIGNQSCVNVAPEVFALDKDQICHVLPAAPAIDKARLIEACESCPVSALSLLDEDGKPIVG
jgi:ferredoxin